MGFLSRLTPRVFVVGACVIALLGGAALGLSWLQAPPDPTAVKQMRGIVRSLEITDVGRRSVRLVLVPGQSESVGANPPERPLPESFSFKAEDWVAGRGLFARSEAGPGAVAIIEYLERPLGEVPSSVRIGAETLLDPNAPAAAAERARNRSMGIGFMAMSAVLLTLGGGAAAARRSVQPTPAADPSLSGGIVVWVLIAGVLALTVALSDPERLQTIFPAPAALWAALALYALLLPALPGSIALTGLALDAHAAGRGGKIGLLSRIFGGLFAADRAWRRRSLLALWFFVYLLVVGVVAAAMLS